LEGEKKGKKRVGDLGHNQLSSLTTNKKPKIGCFTIRLNSYQVQKKIDTVCILTRFTKYSSLTTTKWMGMIINNYATKKTTIASLKIKTNIEFTDKSNISWSPG